MKIKTKSKKKFQNSFAQATPRIYSKKKIKIKSDASHFNFSDEFSTKKRIN